MDAYSIYCTDDIKLETNISQNKITIKIIATIETNSARSVASTKSCTRQENEIRIYGLEEVCLDVTMCENDQGVVAATKDYTNLGYVN